MESSRHEGGILHDHNGGNDDNNATTATTDTGSIVAGSGGDRNDWRKTGGRARTEHGGPVAGWGGRVGRCGLEAKEACTVNTAVRT